LKQNQFPQRLLDTVAKVRWRTALQKLQVWNMSQFDKVLMLDIDSVTTKNLDWVFDLDGVWCQTALSTVGCVFRQVLNSGMLLFIHKGDLSNSCFGLDHAETCKNQTLGRLWHRNFCGARKLMNLQHPSAIELCSADGWDEP